MAGMSQARSRRGYAVLYCMLSVTLLAMMSTAMLSLSSANRRISHRRALGKEAHELAMGVLDIAVKRLQDNPNFTGISRTALGTGYISVSVAAPSGQPGRRWLDATAEVTGFNGTLSRRIRAISDTRPVPSVYLRSLAAKEDLSLDGDITVDSYPTAGIGDVHSNRQVTHDGGGSGRVDGRSTATGTVLLNGSPTITGGVQSGVPPLAFPEITLAFKEQSLVNGVTTGSVSENAGRVVQGKIIGSLNIRSPHGAQINGVVWVTGNANVSGPITGTGAIVCDGQVDVDTREFDLLNDPSNVALMTTRTGNSAITVIGNRKFKGLLFAPEGEIVIQGNSWLYGGAMARNLTFGGTPRITRWTGLGNNTPPLPRIFMFAGYQEL